jgi:colanic acid/amylovoran biosynthesis protein
LWARTVGLTLRRADLVILREELSLEVCRDLGVERLELCDDVAFALRPANGVLPLDPRHGGDRIVGVTVMNSLPGVGAAGYRAYRAALRDGLAEALAGRGEQVVVVSQVAVHSGDSDIDAATGLTEELRQAGVPARFVDLGDESDAALSAFYGRLDLVVASRLHSAILAMCACTPVVALSYLPKTDGVLARVGMPDLVLPAGDLNSTQLAGTVRRALEDNDELRARVAQRLPQLRASAERAVDLALDVAR